jgi:hypothetical protein
MEPTRADTGRVAVAKRLRVRWYNPALGDFEWRETPKSDEETLSLLDGSPYTPTCTDTYRYWRGLGTSITAALIRAGEAAKEEERGDKEPTL